MFLTSGAWSVNYEKITEDFIRKTMDSFNLGKEYQVFLDLGTRTTDLEGDFSAVPAMERYRQLIDQLVDG